MYFPQLSQIATQHVVHIADNHSIQDAVHLMTESNIRDIVVTGEAGLRMLSTRDLIGLRLQELDFDTPLIQVPLRNIYTLSPSATVVDALTMLKGGPFEYVCLMDDDQRLTGIVSYSDLASHLDPQSMSESKQIRDLMHLSSFVVASTQDTLKQVLVALQKAHQTVALIRSESAYVGIITQSQINKTLDEHPHWQAEDWLLPITSIMSAPLMTVPETLSWQEALFISRQKKLKRLIVTDANQEIIGILHQKDLVALVYEEWQENLRRQERQLRSECDLFSGGPLLVFVWKPVEGWPVSFVSPNVVDILGYSSNDITSPDVHFTHIVYPEDLARVGAEVTQFLSEKRSYWEQNYRLIDQEGNCHWFYDYTKPIYDAQTGDVIAIHGYLLDQTEFIHTKHDAEQAEARWRSVLEATDQGVWDWNAQTNTVFFSQQWKRMLGYDENDIGDQVSEWETRIHPEDRDQVFATLNEHLTGASTLYESRHRVRCKDGRYKWILDRGKIVAFDDMGKPLRIIGTHTDITQQKKLADVLEKSESKFRTLFSIYPDATILIDISTMMPIQFNQAAHEQLGYTEAEFYHVKISDYEIIEAPEETRARAERIVATGRDDFETKHRRKDGSIIDVSVSVIAVEINDTACLLSIVRNITQIKQTEQALMLSKMEAEAANRAKSEFLANMSHEIRTPMNGIIGLSDANLVGHDPQTLREQLNKIHHSGCLLLGIINDILDFSKIEAGKLEIDPRPFYVRNLFDNLNSLFAQMAQDKGLTLNITIDDRLDRAYIADELRLRQVLTNLIGNAIKFTQSGSVSVLIHLVKREAQHTYLAFVISDTGIGMTKEQQNRLFRAFSQADTSITRQHGGTGLGLVISQRLVQAMGGQDIELDSQQGKGSRFSFELPLRNCSQAELDALFKTRTSVHHEPRPLQGHILLVEDNSINQEVAKAQLSHIGLTVTLAENGQQAVEKVAHHAFDAVLMDIQMPIMDGYEASRQIRKFNPDIPIVALTAAAMIEDKHKATAAGMNGHLSKPIDTQELSDMLAQWLPYSQEPRIETPPSLPLAQKADDSELDYLNVTQGLVLLGQDQMLYHHLLEHFDEQLNETFLPLVELLRMIPPDTESENWVLAQQTAHSLKGVASNLAAQALARQATELDALLKKKHLPTPSMIERFHETILNTRTQMKRWMAQQQPTPTTPPEQRWSHAEIHDQLTQLHQQVINNEFIDDHRLSQLNAQLSLTQQVDLWRSIQEALDKFDFDHAQQGLTELMADYR